MTGTMNYLFSAQCANERLVLVNILVGKSSSFSAPHHADVFGMEVLRLMAIHSMVLTICPFTLVVRKTNKSL